MDIRMMPEAAPPPLEGDLPRRYLVLVAHAAARLLAAESSTTMVEDLFELIRTELRLDAFFNFRFDGEGLVLETYGGLTPAEVEACATLELGQAVCGCVARDRVAAHCVAVQASDEPTYDFIKSMGMDTYACTPLMHGGELLGTLSFGRRWTDRFTTDELNFLHTVCHYVGVAKHRQRTEAALRESVVLRDGLLAELNHRVRNALQLAISLQTIETSEAASPEIRQALQAGTERLEVLATAHRSLYADDRLADVDLSALLRQVLLDAGSLDTVVTSDADHHATVENATALALLVHEIVSNGIQAAPVRLRLGGREAGGGKRLVVEIAGLARPDGGSERVTRALLRQLRGTWTAAKDGGVVLTLPDLARGED